MDVINKLLPFDEFRAVRRIPNASKQPGWLPSGGLAEFAPRSGRFANSFGCFHNRGVDWQVICAA